MPTLFRFLMTLAILAGLAYGAMVALVWYVEPNIGEMTVRIPAERLNPSR
jgi:SNF family Na+-dependent transporter